MVKTDAKDESLLNGGSEDGACRSGTGQFNTLSGLEAADEQNSWDKFKHLIDAEGFRSNASIINMMASNGGSEDVTLMVCVEDTGIGIPLSAQERVFMPFMQADSSTSRHYGGTGIGLSISKCLVELMRGRISFVSRPQVGSTFSFTAVFGKCKEYVFEDVKQSKSEDLPSGFKGLKAVVVDEKPVRAAVTQYHLNRLGIMVKISSSIKEASSTAKNGLTSSG